MNTRRTGGTIAVAICVLAIAFAAVFALSGCSGAPAASTDQGITVTGSSETKVVPDKARINVAVVTEGKTAEACQADNANATNAVVEALAKLGVEDKSIQTTSTYLSPRYGSQKSDNSEDWVITGYEMTTSLRISDLDIDNVGVAVQACVAAGANETNGIEYYASNYDEAYQQALNDAIATARAKAESIASASSVSLGSVVNVQEGYQDTSARYASNNYDAMEEMAADAGAAKVMPGQESISAEVTVTFAIR